MCTVRTVTHWPDWLDNNWEVRIWQYDNTHWVSLSLYTNYQVKAVRTWQWVHCGQWTVCWEDNNWATLTQLRRNYKDDRWRKTFTLLTFLWTRRSDRILVSDCTVCHDSLWLRDINKLYTLCTLLLLHPIYTKRPIPARRTQSGHSYLVQGPRSSAVNVPTKHLDWI